LTLISAPAGFGKTTLTVEWIANRGRLVAWLSLDEGDSDPIRFLTYFVAALRTALPTIGEEMVSVLNAPPSSLPAIESILYTLLNEISSIPSELTLVLDDYHIVDSRAVDNALTFFIEHMPPQMHLVITSREDPALPIHRLRARNQLTELRAADLRFTATEAAEFLDQVMGLNISADDLAVLEDRTEGWIAGLQLAALSMQGQQDVHTFIQEFAGDHRYIVDYLIEEVLQRQPEAIRNFLLQTSILDPLNGPLCDTVTGQTGSDVRLETLQRGNFFLIPLDDRRQWYRYHHLLADVLRMHLLTEQPNLVPALHRRASAWYEKNGSAPDAIHHALAGRDFGRAADLIELASPAMHRNRQEATALGWMKALPDEVFQTRPVLSILYVAALMSNGVVEGVEPRLRNAERWLDAINDTGERPAELVVVNEDEFHRLPGQIAMYHAGMALARGDVPETARYARQVLELAPEEDYRERGAGAALLGLALWTKGDLEAAYKSFAEGMAQLQKAGNIADAVGGVRALADIRIAQGRLHDAMRTYKKALQLAKDNGTPELRGTADMYVGMGNLEREHNKLHAANQLLLRSQEQGEQTGFPQHPYRWRVTLARIREAEGDLNSALALLDEAELLYVSDFFPDVRPIASLKARVWLAQGRLIEAIDWARERGLSVAEELSYLREFEHVTLARILLAQSRSDDSESPLRDAIELLDRLQKAAEDGGRLGSAIEILILQALAYQARGDISLAMAPLESALKLAEPEGYVRIFLDEGEPMRLLIEEFRSRIERQARDHHLLSYAGNLLDAFTPAAVAPHVAMPHIENQEHLHLAHTAPVDGRRGVQGSKIENLVEPLTERELEVLRLFKSELSGPEIARELMIGLSTVRTHTKSIYSKLGVNSRRAAVKRAIELGLI
jgi:LuxR family maltose regulon positive regulatory protein